MDDLSPQTVYRDELQLKISFLIFKRMNTLLIGIIEPIISALSIYIINLFLNILVGLLGDPGIRRWGSRNVGAWVKGTRRKRIGLQFVEHLPLPQRLYKVELNQHMWEVLCAAASSAVEFISFCSIRLFW